MTEGDIIKTAPMQLPLTFTVNRKPHALAVDPRTSALDLLREHLG